MRKNKECLCSRKHLRVLNLLLLSGVVIILGLTVISLRHVLFPARQVKVVGYICEGDCGGLADRQKGMVFSFVLAAILGKAYKIYMTHPCPLTYYLMPATFDVDWRVETEELKQGQVTQLRKMGHKAVDWAESLLQYDDLESYFTGDYVFVITNMELVHVLRRHRLAQKLRWLQELTVPEIYHKVLTDLFVYMPGLQQKWDHFRASLPSYARLICAQIRVGGSGDTESFNTFKDIDGLVTFLAAYNNSSPSSSSFSSARGPNPYRFLITSDKVAMLEHVQNALPADSLYVQVPGAVTHVDRAQGSDMCAGMSRALVEQHALSTCHVLVISESGFGKLAAFLRGTDSGLFLFHDGRVERATRETQFPNRPSW